MCFKKERKREKKEGKKEGRKGNRKEKKRKIKRVKISAPKRQHLKDSRVKCYNSNDL